MPSSSLPLDLTGTAFQLRVWQALRAISVRTACGANPVAVIVPCHRVVRADGSLGGYRRGLARKQALREGEALSQSACGPAPRGPRPPT